MMTRASTSSIPRLMRHADLRRTRRDMSAFWCFLKKLQIPIFLLLSSSIGLTGCMSTLSRDLIKEASENREYLLDAQGFHEWQDGPEQTLILRYRETGNVTHPKTVWQQTTVDLSAPQNRSPLLDLPEGPAVWPAGLPGTQIKSHLTDPQQIRLLAEKVVQESGLQHGYIIHVPEEDSPLQSWIYTQLHCFRIERGAITADTKIEIMSYLQRKEPRYGRLAAGIVLMPIGIAVDVVTFPIQAAALGGVMIWLRNSGFRFPP